MLVHGDAQSPIQDELLVEHIDGAVAGHNGAGRVARGSRCVQHGKVGQHPLHISALVQVPCFTQNAKLKLGARHRKWVHHTHRDRAKATLVSDRVQLARGALQQSGLARGRQGHVVQAVALALRTRHLHAVAIRRRLDQTSRFW